MNKDEKTIYLIRHGQSDENAKPVFQSNTAPLSEKGIKQAKAVANRFKAIEFDALFSSKLPRAKQTAEEISEATNKEIIFSDILFECQKPSSIGGKPWTDEAAQNTWHDWQKSLVTPGFRVEDGENYDDTTSRAKQVIEMLDSRPESNLAVVSHGLFIRTILNVIVMGDDMSGETINRFYKFMPSNNTGVTIIKKFAPYEGDMAWHLITYNDFSHTSNL